jgi:hypothetical protein
MIVVMPLPLSALARDNADYRASVSASASRRLNRAIPPACSSPPGNAYLNLQAHDPEAPSHGKEPSMYETLQELGVTDLDQIERYTLRQEGDEDILKIYFKRKKGELFAHSMKFRHGRAKKMVQVDSGTHKYKEVSEISPTMQKLAGELDQLVKREESVADFKRRILGDIDHLERVMQRKLEQIRAEIEALE